MLIAMDEDEVIPVYGKSKSAAVLNQWIHDQYNMQMEHWLEYAYEHRHQHKSNQGLRMSPEGFNSKPIGQNKFVGSVKANQPRDLDPPSIYKKSVSIRKINNWTLFLAWKKEWRSENDETKYSKRIYVHYTDAVPEFHALLDFMESNGFPEFEPAP